MKPDQILRTTSHALRPAPPPPPSPPSPPLPTPPPTTTTATRGKPWVPPTLVTALTALWLTLIALAPDQWWPFALPYLACLVIAATPRFSPGRAPGPTLLTALGTAAVLPVLVIAVDLLGLVRPPPAIAIAVTVAAVLAALTAALTARPAAAVRVTAAPDTPSSSPPEPAPARAMGRYRLVARLGIGGMGEVWRAEHDTLARPAALKLIRRQRLEDPALEHEILERFKMEAEVTARLTSPHTVQLYDFGVTADGVLYYAMELLDGMSVHQLVERYGPLDQARCAFLLRHACHSLIEAHDAGLVHRDLKPENLFVARLGRDHDFLKVLDFGLVKELDDAPLDPRDRRNRHRLTIAGARPGTPGFMAPEQITGAGPLDARADVYALGCVAYFMLTGTAVFHGRVEAQIHFAHVSTDPEPPSKRLGRPVHAGLEQILMRCLAKDPAARPTTEALDDALATLVFEPPWSQARARAWWLAVTERPRARANAETVDVPLTRAATTAADT